MISQSVILEEIDDGCYGCYVKGTDENKIKNNENVKNLLTENIKTLEDLECLNTINEYEVDKAFLDKMRYIKEHKNETDNLVYTGGLDFFRRLKHTLEVKVTDNSDDSKELSEAKELYESYNDDFHGKLSVFTEKLTEYNKGIGETFKKQTDEFTGTTNEIYELKKKLSELKAELAGAESKINLDFIIKFNELKNSLDEVIKAVGDVEESKKQLDEAMTKVNMVIAGKFSIERDKFMEQYKVPKTPNIEIPEAVSKNLDADDIYIAVSSNGSLAVLGKNKRVKYLKKNTNELKVYPNAVGAYEGFFDNTDCKYYSDTYNIFILAIGV